MSIESRPTPPQPAGDTGTGASTAPPGVGSKTAATPAEPASTRLEADTLATHAVLERCARRRLLPEQESTVDSALQLLADTRAAIARGDLTRAASLARQARQLSSSLNCP